MNKKLLKLRLPYFFRKRIPRTGPSGNRPELIQPESKLQRVESGIEDILRWADDRGKTLDLGNPLTKPNPDAASERSNKSE